MVALLRLSTVLLVLYIMPEISPYRVNIHDFLPFLPDETEYPGQINSILREIEDDVRRNLQNIFKGENNQMEKRNGDLINFLLGLPKGMLDAGKK